MCGGGGGEGGGVVGEVHADMEKLYVVIFIRGTAVYS